MMQQQTPSNQNMHVELDTYFSPRQKLYIQMNSNTRENVQHHQSLGKYKPKIQNTTSHPLESKNHREEVLEKM